MGTSLGDTVVKESTTHLCLSFYVPKKEFVLVLGHQLLLIRSAAKP